jgi:hypothetical protein
MQIDPRPHLSLDSTREINAQFAERLEESALDARFTDLNFANVQPMSEPVIEFDEDAEVLPDAPLDLAEISTLLLLGAIGGFALFVLFNAELI